MCVCMHNEMCVHTHISPLSRSIVNYAERVPIPIVHEVMPHVTKMGIPESPYQNGDPQTEMGMRVK